MTTQRRTARVTAALIGLALLGACGDRSPTAPPIPAEPSVSFTYSGERSGSYAARGTVPLDAERRPQHGTWAAALQVPGDALSVAAARALDAPLADVFLLALHNISAPGTYPITASCDARTETSCATGMLAFRYDWESSSRLPEPLYMVTSGTITVTAIGAGRVEGSFRAGGARSAAGAPVVALEDGRFDVPITQAQPVRRSASSPNPAVEAFRSILRGTLGAAP